MTEKPSWVPAGVDTTQASIARVYDYWLGGTHNVQADRDAARAMLAVEPNGRAVARANREFLGRAVRFAAAAGVRQFLDIGSGIPTEGNVHQIAGEAATGARVVYADIDPVAVAHSRAILAGSESAAVIQADLRQPAEVLASSEVRRLIDLTEPVALLMCAVLHSLADEDDPWRAVAALRDVLAPGSYLAISHITSDRMSGPVVGAMAKLYEGRVRGVRSAFRSRAEIARFFDGFSLTEPGLVPVTDWRPDRPVADDDPARSWILAGVGRKP